MVDFAPLTPQLRQRIAQGAARNVLRHLDVNGGRADAALETALKAAPNGKSVARASDRLRKVQGIVSATSIRSGSRLVIAARDRYVTDVDRARPGPDGRSINVFETTVLGYRTSYLAWRKHYLPSRWTDGTIYFDAHSIARLIERGPFDPRRFSGADLVPAAQGLLATLDPVHLALNRALRHVEAAEKAGRLAPDLASIFPVPCPTTGGLWVVESSTSGGETSDATVVTYVGANELRSEQHNFMTACGDGDFVGALTAYPEALARRDLSPDMSARLSAMTQFPAETA